MKTILCSLAMMVLLITAAHRVSAQASSDGCRVEIGYKNLDIDYTISHDTHPDDSFLPNAGVPGSAGQTKLDHLNFLALGFGYQLPVREAWSANFELGGLIGLNRDRHQNANDTRPAANGSFVYSQATVGSFAAASLSYRLKPYYVGVEGQLAGIYIESGWDRFGKYQCQSSKFELLPSLGPKLGWQINSICAVEGTVQFGRATTLGFQLVCPF